MPRILIVEDDAFLALDLAQQLEDAGFSIMGPAASVEVALALLAVEECDAAVLDVHLGRGTTSEPIAERLVARAIPFVTVTGFSHEQRSPVYDGAPLLSKPFQPSDLIGSLRHFLSQ